MKITITNGFGRKGLYLLLIFSFSNEIYRHFEIKRLREFNCVVIKLQAVSNQISLTASNKLREYRYTYSCSDKVTRTSIYRNDKFIRLWE